MPGGSSKAKIPAKVLGNVKALLDALEVEGIRVEEAYIFGSYARGDYLEESDVDLVIVSSSFEGMRFMDRLDLVYRIAWRLRLSPWIEAIPLTPGEARERVKGSYVLRDASRYWVRVR